MKKLNCLINFKLFHIFGAFRKYGMFLCLFLVCTITLEARQVQRHHVILLIDQSRGMQPESEENALQRLFDELDKICFSVIDTSVGRPLLMQEKGDYLSIVTFGLRYEEKDFTSYTHTGREFGKRNYSYGGTYNDRFDGGIIKDLKNMIFNEIRYYNFFDLPYAFPSYSVPLVLRDIATRRNGQVSNRLFIIRISDRKLNSDDLSQDEILEQDEGLVREAHRAKEKLKEAYDYDKQLLSLSRSFARKTSTQVDQIKYKGKNYYVDTYEVTPKKMIAISNVFKLPQEVNLKRGKNSYKGEFNIIQEQNPYLSPDTLFVDYSLNNHIIQQDTVSAIHAETYTKTIHLDRKGYSISAGDTLLVKLSLVGKYKNDFFEGLQVNEILYPELATSFKGVFEKDAEVWFFGPIGDKLIFAKDQYVSAWIINGLICLGLIMFFLVVFVFIMTISPYPVKNNQFTIK